LQTTGIEQAPHLRTAGYAIDFGGSGWDVADHMHLISALRQRENTVPFFIFKDSAGCTLASLPTAVFLHAFQDKMVQIIRPDLEAVLYETIRDTVSIRFGTSSQQIGSYLTMSWSPSRTAPKRHSTSSAPMECTRTSGGWSSVMSASLLCTSATTSRHSRSPNLDHFKESAIICLEPNRQATVYPGQQRGYTALLVYRAQDAGHIAAAQFAETAPDARATIWRGVRTIGSERAQAFVAQAQEVEANGGMLIPDGRRKRTLGGIFFYLVRTQVRDEAMQINRAWRSKHKRKKLAQGQAAPPTPTPPTLSPFVWDEADPIIAELTANVGAAPTVNVTIVGRPAHVVESQALNHFGTP
jgi:hypothetical protein